jgi:GH24 family phage-related lysozyme (muramidase)
MPFERKHAIGVLTAGVIALAAGTAAQQGFIPHWEGEQHHAVRNAFDPINPATGKKVVTVCNGHTDLDDPNLKEGDYYTRVMCADVLSHDLVKYNRDLVRYLGPNYMVSDHMHVALLSFDINTGPGNFKKIARLLRAGHRREACRAMGQYVRAAGVVLKGLHNRRYDQFWGEIAWCLRDD